MPGSADNSDPILFQERPLPGPEVEGKLVRHKSFGHHTEGFDTREEALRSIDDTSAKMEQSSGRALAGDFEWDGEETPALVAFFEKNQDGTYTPTLCG